MRKVLLLGEVDLTNESIGVMQKVLSQAKAFDFLGASVYCIGYRFSNIVLDHLEGGKFTTVKTLGRVSNIRTRRFPMWKCIGEYLSGEKFDLAYIRYPIIDFAVLNCLKKIRSSCSKVVLEIPSYPLEIKNACFRRKVLYTIDLLLHNRCQNFVDRILYVGNKTPSIFGCESFQIPNGIPEKIKETPSTGYQIDRNVINLIAVSNMHPFHGYDRLINGLAKYYATEERDCKVHITLVGDGICRKEYESMVSSLNLSKYVHFTGRLQGEQLNEAYRKASLGIGSLGMYREGFREASSLKTKEYLIRGLPFAYAVDEIGFRDDFPYAIKLPNEDGAIAIEELVDFAEKISQLNKEMVIKEMREYADVAFSWAEILRKACGEFIT